MLNFSEVAVASCELTLPSYRGIGTVQELATLACTTNVKHSTALDAILTVITVALHGDVHMRLGDKHLAWTRSSVLRADRAFPEINPSLALFFLFAGIPKKRVQKK
jgi:hypothetical protein